MMERGVGDTHVCLSRPCFIVHQFQVYFLFFCYFRHRRTGHVDCALHRRPIDSFKEIWN